ncbi:MAG: AmmeMemoRadiSam system protein B [Phycisphaerae bacterium]|nr:AmmeMemoRadiSam system protein B [Phycisphaerae bacterium]
MSAQHHGPKADDLLPALRAVDITPLQGDDGELHFVLQDRTRIAPQSLALSPAGYFVLAYLDGEHSCADVQAAFLQQSGMILPADQVKGLVRVLDEALMLKGERYEQAYAQRGEEYRAAPARDNRERYPDGAELRSEIEKMLAGGVIAPVREVRGLIAPHLDYARGAPCYADAYATLAKVPPAERYVILGTNHAGRATSAVATTKDFQTPFGLVRTDRDFLRRLEDKLEQAVCEHELDHLWEHSVELQLHILQVITDGQPFEIVPVLCPNPCLPSGTGSERDTGQELRDFADMLGSLVAEEDRRTTIIAGADLSHVGQQFGDPEPTTPTFLEEVGRLDRELLSLLECRQEEEFVSRLRATSNPTRVCSVGCIYALLRSLPRRACRVLSYHQAANIAAETNVTCAAVIIG